MDDKLDFCSNCNNIVNNSNNNNNNNNKTNNNFFTPQSSNNNDNPVQKKKYNYTSIYWYLNKEGKDRWSVLKISTVLILIK
jgi:hypothetical protein